MSMWNKRDSEGPERPVEPRPNLAAPASASASGPQPSPRRGSSSIGGSVTIKGEIHAKEELVIDGDVEGTVESQDKVTIGVTGKLRAQVKAREIIVRGQLRGNVVATDRITIHKDAQLSGDVKTAGIIIEDGAYFKGSIDIIKGEAVPAKEPARATPEPLIAASAGR
ncbi:MAG: polymer-forming cytoskeletal protein [Bryobacteraceae bacterium]